MLTCGTTWSVLTNTKFLSAEENLLYRFRLWCSVLILVEISLIVLYTWSRSIESWVTKPKIMERVNSASEKRIAWIARDEFNYYACRRVNTSLSASSSGISILILVYFLLPGRGSIKTLPSQIICNHEPQAESTCSFEEVVCVSGDTLTWFTPTQPLWISHVVSFLIYSENSRFDLGPPVQILKELENNILVLSDTEISDEDVPVLCRFFNHPEVLIFVLQSSKCSYVELKCP